ncbi:MAG: outer membrane beta-barrel protein [Bacteroidia bacterium]
MKKSLLLLAIALMSQSSWIFAQSPLPVGKAQVNLGLGLSGWGVPFYVGIDYSAHKDITLGAEFSYRSYRENWKNAYYNHRITGFSGNANYHFNSLLKIPRNWDLYAGLNIGFYSWNSDKAYPGSYNSGLGLGAQLGGRYYLNNKLGLNLELGGGNAFSSGKFGISIKI